jgi:hypothetical protein
LSLLLLFFSLLLLYCYCYLMVLPSPGWTPLCLYHVRLEHPGLRRAGTFPEGFTTHGARPLLGTAPPGNTLDNAPTPSPNQDIFFNLWGFTTQALTHDAYFIGAWTPVLPIPGALLQAFLFCAPPTRALEIHFLSSQGFSHDGLEIHSPHRPPGFLTLVLCSQWHCPLGFAFAVFDTPGPLPSHIRSSRPQEDLDCPGVVLPSTWWGHFWGLNPSQGMPR